MFPLQRSIFITPLCLLLFPTSFALSFAFISRLHSASSRFRCFDSVVACHTTLRHRQTQRGFYIVTRSETVGPMVPKIRSKRPLALSSG